MLVSYKWLQELVDVKDIDVNQLADKMSRSGIEVEDVTIPEEGLKKLLLETLKNVFLIQIVITYQFAK